jgi:hypothetical protein
MWICDEERKGAAVKKVRVVRDARYGANLRSFIPLTVNASIPLVGAAAMSRSRNATQHPTRNLLGTSVRIAHTAVVLLTPASTLGSLTARAAVVIPSHRLWR